MAISRETRIVVLKAGIKDLRKKAGKYPATAYPSMFEFYNEQIEVKRKELEELGVPSEEVG